MISSSWWLLGCYTFMLTSSSSLALAKRLTLNHAIFLRCRIPAAGALGYSPEDLLVVIALQLGRGGLLCWIECEGEAIEMTLG